MRDRLIVDEVAFNLTDRRDAHTHRRGQLPMTLVLEVVRV
jgi:hypothetical protein